jgi:HK97 family phage major capsid protein
MSVTDALVSRLRDEVEERRAFQDHLLESAQAAGRDVNAQEMELYRAAADRISACNAQLEPLQEGLRIASESTKKSNEIARLYQTGDRAQLVVPEYRSAGEYIVDYVSAAQGSVQARNRFELFNRAAAHQTTPDNLGIIPEPIATPLLNFIDASRPMVNAIGPTALPGGSGRFNIPNVTQHTDTGKQAGEKAELTSQKMLITRTAVAMDTWGGYVNVSRQDIDWSVPQIMDIIVSDLAAQYARDTETDTGTTLKAGATAQTPVLTSASTAAAVATAVWQAVGTAYAATPGVNRFLLLVAPDMMGVIGPLFPGVNPTNAQSSGFNAADYGSGVMGNISGVTVVMSYGLAAGTILLLNGPAARCYEQRIGVLSVTEPSVLGVQVAYAGYFKSVALVTNGIIKLTA